MPQLDKFTFSNQIFFFSFFFFLSYFFFLFFFLPNIKKSLSVRFFVFSFLSKTLSNINFENFLNNDSSNNLNYKTYLITGSTKLLDSSFLYTYSNSLKIYFFELLNFIFNDFFYNYKYNFFKNINNFYLNISVNSLFFSKLPEFFRFSFEKNSKSNSLILKNANNNFYVNYYLLDLFKSYFSIYFNHNLVITFNKYKNI